MFMYLHQGRQNQEDAQITTATMYVAVADQKLGVYPRFMEVPQSASSMEPSVNKISRNLIVPYYL